MTKLEYIIAKNSLVFRVTGKVLVPDDQIDGSGEKKRLSLFGHILYDASCPYCVDRYRKDYSYDIDCTTCPMYLADNECTEDSGTWFECNEIWKRKATAEDRVELEHLIDEYNEGIE